jgi:hypothetical protein
VALLTVLGLGTMVNGTLAAAPFKAGATNAVTSTGAVTNLANGMVQTASYHNDTSPALRSIPPVVTKGEKEKEAPPNWALALNHKNGVDTVVQSLLAPLAMPGTILNFDGIGFPGVGCNCAPPDTNGEVGATQYVQMVNEGVQVWNKTTGASVFGPVGIATLWSGFGGVCETGGAGDPVVLYDQIANRWLISQFAGGSTITDECIAISQTSDATGSYYRYGFHLGSNFFDYPHLGVWPDAYYMSMNIFNSSGTAYLGPQPFAFDRAKMLAGQAATFITLNAPMGSNVDPILPADLDGSTLPPAGAPNSFVAFPGTTGNYDTYHFHVDFATPANSTWTTFASPTAAPFTLLCPTTRACVPQLAPSTALDAIADRLMFRLAYRNFGTHESLVGNYTVSSSGVAGVRWFELRNVTAGPVTVHQESTYQPDTTWRWMASAAQDTQGNLAVGFSASSASIHPEIRYAGRLVGDPLNQLAQGEATLFAGAGSQTGTGSRWGDYSDITVDPVDDCTFWYTSEYYATNSSFNWKTRIGNFKFPGCTLGTPTPTVTGTPPTATPTQTSTSTPTATSTPCVLLTPVSEGFETGLGGFASAVATCAPGGCGWAAVTTDKHSGTQSAFAPDRNNISDQRLELTNGFAVPAGATSAVLSFWHRVALENTFDGGVLEFSTDGGSTWSTTVPTFITGGYNSTISTSFGSPIGGRQAWSGTIGSTGSFVNVQVNLMSYAGQNNVRFRFREANDSSVAATGWWVDDVTVTITATCPNGTPTPTVTSAPPTATNTAVPPTVTSTAVPPTATDTAVPPTVPPGSTATATTVPPTATAPAATATSAPPTATSTPVNCPLPFTDVDEFNPFYQYIQCLYCRGIISGYSDNTFRWTNDVTRGQVSKIIANSAGLNATVTGQTFTDVPASNPFYVYIERLAATGAISGYDTAANCPTGTPCFRWELPVTRGQLAKIDANAAGYNETPSGQTFRDVPAANPFYVFIERLSLHGVINGYTCGGPGEPCPGLYYRPFNNITRGQVSKVASQTFFPNACAPAQPAAGKTP